VRVAAVLVEATVVKMAFARAAMAAGTALAVAAGSAWTVLELGVSGSEHAVGEMKAMLGAGIQGA